MKNNIMLSAEEIYEERKKFINSITSSSVKYIGIKDDDITKQKFSHLYKPQDYQVIEFHEFKLVYSGIPLIQRWTVKK